MLLTEEVELTWTNNRKIYEPLGYKYTKNGDKFIVKIKDLSPYSHVEVDIKCDYCGKYLKIGFHTRSKRVDNGLIKKDACEDCKILKKKESNLIKYGSESHNLKFLDTVELSKIFLEKGLVLLDDVYKTSHSNLNYRCVKHPEIIQSTSYANFKAHEYVCMPCSVEARSGEGHHNWKNGNTELNKVLRQSIHEWKKLSLKFCNYKCVLTNNKFDNIHHLYGFDSILKEISSYIELDMNKTLVDYTSDELKLLIDECNKAHERHGVGICLNYDIHKLFHSTYGYGNNTHLQFKQFIQRLQLGEFNTYLQEHNLTLNLNYEALNKLALL